MTAAQRIVKQAWDREYAQTHAVEKRQRARVWGQTHRIRASANHARWRKANPAKWAAVVARRKARQRGATIITLTREQWEAILYEFDYLCAYCSEAKPLEQDHMIPLSRGGAHTVENIVPACRSCNAAKGDRTAEEFVAEYAA